MVTLGAALRVGFDPGRVFGLIALFFDPLSCYLAVSTRVSHLTASEAEFRTTGADHVYDIKSYAVFLATEITFGVRAPANAFVFICIVFAQPLPVGVLDGKIALQE